MAKEFARLGFALLVCIALATTGCTKEPTTGGNGATPSAATRPTDAGATPADATAAAPSTAPAAAGEAGLNPLYTLPPSKGPAPHQFRQVTLLRSGPSGDLEMQLTGDGIYRIRDHGRGQSYAGSGKLEDAEVAVWAEVFKDWESLKDSYLPDPAPAAADKVRIVYGGKTVVAAAGHKDTPKPFAEAYNRLLALNEQSKKEAGVTDAPAKDAAGTGAGGDKK